MCGALLAESGDNVAKSDSVARVQRRRPHRHLGLLALGDDRARTELAARVGDDGDTIRLGHGGRAVRVADVDTVHHSELITI